MAGKFLIRFGKDKFYIKKYDVNYKPHRTFNI